MLSAKRNYNPVCRQISGTELVRDAKDVAAGAVLITAIAAAVIAVLIFGPHVAKLFPPVQ